MGFTSVFCTSLTKSDTMSRLVGMGVMAGFSIFLMVGSLP